MRPQRGQDRDGPWPDGGDDCPRRLLTGRGQLPGRACTFLHMKVLTRLDEAVCQVFEQILSLHFWGFPQHHMVTTAQKVGVALAGFSAGGRTRRNPKGPARPPVTRL